MKRSGYDKFFSEVRRAKQSPTTSAAPARAESPEDRLRARIKNQLTKRKKTRQEARGRSRPFPVMAAVIAVFGIGIIVLDQAYPELVGRSLDELGGLRNFVSRIELDLFSSAAAKEEEKSSQSSTENKANSAGPADKKTKPKVPDTKNWTQEELSFFNRLGERKRELDVREAELAKLEEELLKQKEELDKKIKLLEKMRSEVAKRLETRVAEDQTKVNKLVDFYSTMKAPQAAKIIESINEDLAVEILDRLKKKNAAEIMNAMDAKKARRLSELLTGYQRTSAMASRAEPTKATDMSSEAESDLDTQSEGESGGDDQESRAKEAK